jgi:Meckel syndrome type 1 protein
LGLTTPSIVKSVAALQLASSEGSAADPIEDDEPQTPGLDAKAQAADPAQPAADPAAVAIATPASLVPAAAMTTHAGPQTVASLAAQIVKGADSRSTQFDVQLDPAGLGKVDVHIAIGSDGRMSAAMSFDTPQAAAELKSRAGELQRALEQSGFDVSGGMSFDVAGGQGGQGGQGQNPQTQTGAAFRGRAFQAALDTSVDAAPAPQLTLRRNAVAGVDIRI